MERKIKIGLLVFLLATIFIPLKRNALHFIKTRPLNGVFELAEKPDLLIKNWFNGEYQADYSKYYEDHIGFRNFFVRVNNQVQYSLYKKTRSNKTVIGQDNYLFERGYIDDYMGYSFVGEERIEGNMINIKRIQVELKKDSVTLLMAFAPGKASYFPEYFPSEYDTSKKTISNYNCYVAKCRKFGVNFIDFNSYFLFLKKENNIKLFSKGGIHWGEYGVAVALDSLSKVIEQIRGINMIDFEYNKIDYPDTLLKSDKDISDVMNLIFEPSFYRMPYPNYIFKKSLASVKPRLLIIGDSYSYGILNSPITKELYREIEFWYYNRDIKPKRKDGINKVDSIDVKESMKQFDVVLMLYTETNLCRFDFGFIDCYNKTIIN